MSFEQALNATAIKYGYHGWPMKNCYNSYRIKVMKEAAELMERSIIDEKDKEIGKFRKELFRLNHALTQYRDVFKPHQSAYISLNENIESIRFILKNEATPDI